RGHLHERLVPAEPGAGPLGDAEPPDGRAGLAVQQSRGRPPHRAGARGDEHRQAQAALRPAPAPDPRRRAMALRLPADGHLRREQSPQVDSARRRINTTDRNRVLLTWGGPVLPPTPPPAPRAPAQPRDPETAAW